MHRGYIKLWRKLEEWEWFDHGHMFKLFCWLLMRASHKDTKYRGHVIKRGQVVFGLHKASKATGITPQSIRSCLFNLKSTSEITTQPTNRFTIVTICNYNTYQSNDEEINNRTNNLTNKQLTSNQQTTNNIQECKEYKNDKNIKDQASPTILKDVNPKKVDLSDIEVFGLSEAVKHRAYNNWLILFKTRGWITEPQFVKRFFGMCAEKLNGTNPENPYPYFMAVAEKFINENSELISEMSKIERNKQFKKEGLKQMRIAV